MLGRRRSKDARLAETSEQPISAEPSRQCSRLCHDVRTCLKLVIVESAMVENAPSPPCPVRRPLATATDDESMHDHAGPGREPPRVCCRWSSGWVGAMITAQFMASP